ncbi:hypothetical protein APSETT445_009309 [Aspergillus pseudonomiae]
MLAFVNIPEVLPKKKFTIAIRELPGQLDLIGFALFAPSAIQLLLALQYGGNQFTWHSSQVIGLFCGAGATFIAFLLWDYKQGDKAMIPFSMIRKRVVWSSSLAYGLLMAQPVIAVQNILPPAQIPVATALVMFSQTLAGGLFLTFSDTILTNSLSTLIPKYAPSVDAKTIIHAGPTEFRSYVTDQQLPGVVLAYAKSVDRVFYLTTATAAGSFFFSCFMGWKDIRKKKIVSKA